MEDTTWVGIRNQELEDAFCVDVKKRHPTLEGEELQEKMTTAGKRKRVCVAEKEIRKDLVELFLQHLRWHPTTRLGLSAEEASKFDIKDVWMHQTAEMHEACKANRESWAWEYLFTNWYAPNKWTIWARAVGKQVPIINSNAPVKSIWSVIKKKYRRKLGRPKLEVLVDVLMNLYLWDHMLKIRDYRMFTRCRPVWYASANDSELTIDIFIL